MPHSHAPDPSAVEATKSAIRIRQVVRENPSLRPSQVISQELQRHLAKHVQPSVRRKQFRRRVWRQKRGLLPAEPTRLDTLVLPDEFKSTGEQPPQPFLIYDSGAAAAKRTLQALGHCIRLVR